MVRCNLGFLLDVHIHDVQYISLHCHADFLGFIHNLITVLLWYHMSWQSVIRTQYGYWHSSTAYCLVSASFKYWKESRILDLVMPFSLGNFQTLIPQLLTTENFWPNSLHEKCSLYICLMFKNVQHVFKKSV